MGAAWGYAWGGCNWRGGDVDVDINRNTNINNNIDRSKYQNKISNREGGRGEWKHNPEHRKGVSYRDQGTAQKFDRGGSRDAQSREAFRGRAEAGRQDIARGDADKYRDRSPGSRQESAGRGTQVRWTAVEVSSAETVAESIVLEARSGRNKDAFGGYERGSQTRNSSNRGHQSMSSSRASGGSKSSVSRPSGGGGSVSRPSGGGGARGGGRGR
jgi:hypothetical protein